MSEQIRQLNGRIEIIFGKEDQDNGISVSGSADGASFSEIGNDVRKALISLNDSDFTNPIFMLGHFELYRKPRLIGNKKLYRAVIGETGAVLNYEFTQPRSVAKWTVSGIKYDYGKDPVYADSDTEQTPVTERKNSYAVEIPSDITISLFEQDSTVASVSKRYTLITSSGTYTDAQGQPVVVDVSEGIRFKCEEAVIPQIFFDQDISFDTGVSAANKFKRIEVGIASVRRMIVSDNGSTRSYDYGENVYMPDSSTYPFAAGPCNVCWLARCYDNQTEIYDGGEIKNLEIDRQLPDSEGDIAYGIVSNSMKATILNADRKFDIGYLKDTTIVGKRVIPYVSVDGKEHKLGTYYVSEWDIPMDNSWVEFSANDRLSDLRNLMYTGFFPETESGSDAFKPESMYRIIETAIEQINENLIIQLENKIYYDSEALAKLTEIRQHYGIAGDENDSTPMGRLAYKMRRHIENGGVLIEGIDWEYLDWMIPDPYLERQSLWDVLDNIAKSSLSVIYMDTQDRLIMHSDLTDERRFYLDGKMYCYTIGGEYREISDDEPLRFGETITASNAFSLSKPRKRKGAATEVSTDYTVNSFGGNGSGQESELITYYIKDLRPVAETEQTAEYRIYVPQFTSKLSCICNGSAVSLIGDDPNEDKNRRYFRVTVNKDGASASDSCTLTGVTSARNSAKITVRDVAAENANAIEYSSGTLLNCETSAKRLCDRLIGLYAAGRQIFEAEWYGDLENDINAPVASDFTLKIGGDTLSSAGVYRIVGNSLTFDGSLRQRIKALSFKA